MMFQGHKFKVRTRNTEPTADQGPYSSLQGRFPCIYFFRPRAHKTSRLRITVDIPLGRVYFETKTHPALAYRNHHFPPQARFSMAPVQTVELSLTPSVVALTMVRVDLHLRTCTPSNARSLPDPDLV